MMDTRDFLLPVIHFPTCVGCGCGGLVSHDPPLPFSVPEPLVHSGPTQPVTQAGIQYWCSVCLSSGLELSDQGVARENFSELQG